MLHASAGRVASSARLRTPRRRHIGRALLAGGFLAIGLATSVVPASAQTVPTVPCEGCGPGAPGDGSRVWSYTEFVCVPQRGFLLRFGVGRDVGERVDFSAGTGPVSQAVIAVQPVRDGVAPGAGGSVLIPEPATGTVRIRVIGVGVRSGRVLLDNTRELECVCPEAATTTTPTTVPGTTTPTVAATSTTPGTAPGTTSPDVTATPTSVTRSSEAVVPDGRLPETGSQVGVTVLGVALVAAGLAAMLVVARAKPGDETG